MVSFDGSGLKQKISSKIGELAPTKSNAGPGMQSRGFGEILLSSIVSDGTAPISFNGNHFLYNADFFTRFPALNVSDFNVNYGYEMVIADPTAKGSPIIARYIFPINPQAINISVPAAVSTEVTMKGIVETHNGAPLRTITLSGTTGILPKDSHTAVKNDTSELRRTLEYAFKNTIKAVERTVNQVNRTVSAFGGGTSLEAGPLNYTKDKAGAARTMPKTGYEDMHDLARFLDFYLAGKKKVANKNWRLLFYMHKDKMYYHCTLGSYSMNKSAGNIKYGYNINLVAWKRDAAVIGNVIVKSSPLGTKINSISKLNAIINGIKQSRNIIITAFDVLAGIRSDMIESIIVPLGEANLLVSDAVGLVNTMGDFAFNGDFSRSMEEAFKQYVSNSPSETIELDEAVLGAGLVGATDATTGKTSSALQTSVERKNEDGQAESSGSSSDSSDPLKVAFNAPYKYPQLFEKVNMDTLQLPSELQDQREAILNSVRSLDSDDIIKRRDLVEDFARSVSEAFGGGSATYNRLNDLQPVRPTYRKLTVDDMTILKALNDSIQALDSLAAELQRAKKDQGENYYTFYADYAVSSGFVFDTNNASKFFVPFPYGASLEQIAVTYLGSVDRWLEIAALNGLRSPYVDEVGYEIRVISSSGGNTLAVSEAPDLYIGQVVSIVSDVEKKIIRKVRSIDIVSSVESILTFEDGDESLTAYRPSQNARIIAYKPNTVNSNMLIAIPTASDSTITDRIGAIPSTKEDLSIIARIAQKDFMLDTQGDIIMTGGGDIKLADGIANVVQAAVLKLKTKSGSMLQHPDYGNPLDAGISVADLNTAGVLEALNAQFASDPKFSGVLASKIVVNGPGIEVSILVQITEGGATFPITVQVPL